MVRRKVVDLCFVNFTPIMKKGGKIPDCLQLSFQLQLL